MVYVSSDNREASKAKQAEDKPSRLKRVKAAFLLPIALLAILVRPDLFEPDDD